MNNDIEYYFLTNIFICQCNGDKHNLQLVVCFDINKPIVSRIRMVSIKELETEIVQLKSQLAQKESLLAALKYTQEQNRCERKNRLTNNEIGRYSRQIILSEIGVRGQIALKHASVLIVGAGGLGTPFLPTLPNKMSIEFSSILYRLSSGALSHWCWNWTSGHSRL